MSFKIALLVLCFLVGRARTQDFGFKYNGFQSSNLSLNGLAELTSNGLLRLTNNTRQETGHTFYPNPITFKNSNGSTLSFSTTFVFAIQSEFPALSGHGMAFVVSPTRDLSGAPAQFLGLFNSSNNNSSSNHVFAVELDTIQNTEFQDIDGNHVGIDINSMISKVSKPAQYYSNGDGDFHNSTLYSGEPIQVWVEYDGVAKKISVTLAPFKANKPSTPLLSLSYDLSPILEKTMYVGFSSSTGSILSSHFVLGWSFKVNGTAQGLDLSRLPKLPRVGPKKKSKLLTVLLPVILLTFLFITISGVAYYIRRKRKYAEELDDWELEYAPHRFRYKELYIATKGFREQELLGTGGFGMVFRGVLPSSIAEIAVKRVSHESRQGMREFVAEIASLGRVRHRNIVPLLGYCRRKGELLLVYEYMPNGSLDKFLYNQPEFTLYWDQRFRVIKGLACGLVYLHEEWEQVVIHRDVKASNVLLDEELNGRLGDFGLARLYDHGADPQTTNVGGTLGYLAPELSRTGRATTSTDVYSFGAFLLEVVCGRRPIEPQAPVEDMILVDYVFAHWCRGDILSVVDQRLGNEYVKQEVELVLKLGLLCSNYEAAARPNMRQILMYLEGAIALPDLSSLCITGAGLTFAHNEGFDEFITSHGSLGSGAFSYSSSTAESLLSGGR